MKRTNNYHIESRDNEKTDDFTEQRKGEGVGRGKGKKNPRKQRRDKSLESLAYPNISEVPTGKSYQSVSGRAF